MARGTDAANRIAVALVAVLINFNVVDEATRLHPDAIRIQSMIQEAIDSGEVTFDELLVAIGVLGARAVEDAARMAGEPTSAWLQRWQIEPFG
jgi:hypothetical protein